MKDNKYFGEIWLPENESKKSFCILEKKENKIYLTTNLKKESSTYKIDEILGVFSGLGYLTFIGNRINFTSSGMIETLIYTPKYTFYGNHHIEPKNLVLNEFLIVNEEITKWIWYSPFSFEGRDKVLYDGHMKKEAVFSNKEIKFSLNTGLKKNFLRSKVNLETYGYVKFETTEDLSLLDAINLYNRFQKFLYFFHGKSSQFTEFSFKCKSCKEWFQVYYYDNLSREKNTDFNSLNFKDLENEFEEIIYNWFNNEKIIFCIDIILENILSVRTSHNRRFVNSIFSFEAFSKRFVNLQTENKSLKKYLIYFKEYFIEIGKISDNKINEFTSKIVRSRDYYVHSNESQSKVFPEFELLYISFLIDSVISIEIMKLIGVSEKNIVLMKKRAESTFVVGQDVNKLLNQNIFNS